MDRSFDRSTKRRRRTLDGRWEFITDPDDEGVEADWASSFPSADADWLAVPGSWTATAEYADYAGPAWYRREFHLPDPTGVVLTFGGVGHEATVYLDGERLDAHEGGYTPFWTFDSDLDSGAHELVVRVDNRPERVSTLPDDPDWFPHGGLYREVVLEEVSGAYVSGIDVEYDLDGDTADVQAAVSVHNVNPTPREGQVAFSLGDAVAQAPVEVRGFDAEILEFDLALEDVERWTPADPTLYDVVAAVTGGDGESGDDLHDRIGFREVAVDGGDLLLNGDPIDVAGVDLAEDHPDWGHALPLTIQRTDLEAIADAGFTAVRASDHPVHQRFLDLCDETGLLAIEGFSPGEGANDPGAREVDEELLDDRQEGVPGPGDASAANKALTDVIDRHRHHPSLVAWSVGSTGSDVESVDGVRYLRDTAASMDDARLFTSPVTAAELADDADPDRFGDFLSLAVDESGGPIDEQIDRVAGDGADVPVVVTGFRGSDVDGVDATADDSDRETARAAALESGVESLLGRSDIAGFTVRRLADSRVADLSETPATDDDGLLTAHRRPKTAYRVLRELLAGD